MRALRRIRPGTVEVVDVEPRSPAPGEVLVEIDYAGVNPFDVQVSRGEIGPHPDEPVTLGAEAVGRIDGRPVLVTGGGLGSATDGTFARQVVAPAAAVHEVPADADPRAVATVGIAGRTAWRAVHQLAEVTAADVVVVLGATGGVGDFAAQLARNLGATVLAVTGSTAKAGRLEALGVEPFVVDGPATLADRVRERGVTVVLDPLGGDYVSALLPTLAVGARVVTYGVLAGRATTIDLAVLYGRGIRMLGTSGGSTPPEQRAAALESALREVVEGRVEVAYEVLDLESGPAAFARLAQRSVAGKLLLRP